MSNHFTYEIDERNIRLQLKGFKIEAKEEDWQRFQGHSSENYNFRQGIKVEDRFNITLNRNVVLPVVFGIIILVFSLLLVNFMSIKNTPKSVTVTPDKIEDKPQSDLKVSPQPTKSNIQVQQQTSPEVALLVPSIETTTITPTEIQTPPALAKETPVENTHEKQSPIESTVAIASSNSENAATTNKEPTKKKRKKRLLESVESEQSAELRPTLVSEDREAEVRPE